MLQIVSMRAMHANDAKTVPLKLNPVHAFAFAHEMASSFHPEPQKSHFVHISLAFTADLMDTSAQSNR
jgi:hypothetical protein